MSNAKVRVGTSMQLPALSPFERSRSAASLRLPQQTGLAPQQANSMKRAGSMLFYRTQVTPPDSAQLVVSAQGAVPGAGALVVTKADARPVSALSINGATTKIAQAPAATLVAPLVLTRPSSEQALKRRPTRRQTMPAQGTQSMPVGRLRSKERPEPVEVRTSPTASPKVTPKSPPPKSDRSTASSSSLDSKRGSSKESAEIVVPRLSPWEEPLGSLTQELTPKLPPSRSRHRQSLNKAHSFEDAVKKIQRRWRNVAMLRAVNAEAKRRHQERDTFQARMALYAEQQRRRRGSNSKDSTGRSASKESCGQGAQDSTGRSASKESFVQGAQAKQQPQQGPDASSCRAILREAMRDVLDAVRVLRKAQTGLQVMANGVQRRQSYRAVQASALRKLRCVHILNMAIEDHRETEANWRDLQAEMERP